MNDVVGRRTAVWDAGWEIPDIARAQIIYESLSGFVDCIESDGSVEDQRPFVGLMPVQLTVCIGLKAHIDACHCSGDRELVDIPMQNS